jgi:hypothetical protein
VIEEKEKSEKTDRFAPSAYTFTLSPLTFSPSSSF